jgi:hypothetical protein
MEEKYTVNVAGIGPVEIPRIENDHFFTIEGVGPVTLEYDLGYVPHIYPTYVGNPPSNICAIATDITERTAKIVAEPGCKWTALIEKRSKEVG